MSLLTEDEKVAQLSTYNFVKGPGITPGIPRIGVAPTQWHSEGLHGLRCKGSGVVPAYATLFPQVTAMAATRNATAYKLMARVMAVEARALRHKQMLAGTVPQKGAGLSYWGPTQNIIRDPRWGRGQESVSESPLVNG